MPSKSQMQAAVARGVRLGPAPQPRKNYKCEMCGVDRIGIDNERNAKRYGKFCQPCSVKARNASRPPKKTKEQKAEYQAAHYQKNKAKLDAYAKEWRQRERSLLIVLFGGKCRHCGESDPIVLDFDHINNDGHKESGKNLIFSVKANPAKFQLLCKNCNWKKEYWRRKDA